MPHSVTHFSLLVMINVLTFTVVTETPQRIIIRSGGRWLHIQFAASRTKLVYTTASDEA